MSTTPIISSGDFHHISSFHVSSSYFVNLTIDIFLEDSNPMVYPNFDPMGISRAKKLKMNELLEVKLTLKIDDLSYIALLYN